MFKLHYRPSSKGLGPLKHVVRGFDFWLMCMKKIRLGGENSPCVPH
ncbi:hypothetical protein A2U01_0119314, partial [Trifolium medium]|nr:hypothetical protein [Trifolium medium]